MEYVIHCHSNKKIKIVYFHREYLVRSKTLWMKLLLFLLPAVSRWFLFSFCSKYDLLLGYLWVFIKVSSYQTWSPKLKLCAVRKRNSWVSFLSLILMTLPCWFFQKNILHKQNIVHLCKCQGKAANARKNPKSRMFLVKYISFLTD